MPTPIPAPWFSLQRFEGPPNPTPPAPPAPSPPAPADPTPPEPPAPKSDKTFTQTELEQIIADRLKRQAAQFQGYDDLKKKAEEFDKLQDAQKTELERERDARTQAEQRAQEATERANRAAIRAAVVAEATKQKAISPDDVLAVLAADAVKIAEDGSVTGVTEAVKAALEARPHWVVDNRPSGSADGGPRLDGGGAKDFRTASKDEFAGELARYGLRSRS